MRGKHTRWWYISEQPTTEMYTDSDVVNSNYVNMKSLIVLLSLLVAGCRSQQINCDLGNPGALGVCLKQLLHDARGKVRTKADPLVLPDHGDGDFKAWNIRINGLAGYNVDNLSITFPRDQQIAVSATIAWPGVTGDLSGRVKKCKKIIFKKVCASASAKPHVSLARTAGTLKTTLTVSIDPNTGKVSVAPSGTSVALKLPRIRVKVNLTNRVTSFINRILGDPASKIATKLSNKWWSNNRGKIEAKARDALEKAVLEDVSPKLANLLKV